MNKHVLIFICGMILMGCTSEPLKTSQLFLSEADISSCQEVACPEVSVQYVNVEGDDEGVDLINTQLKISVIDALYLGDSAEGSPANTIEEAVTDFIKEYRMENAEFPGMAAEYFAEVDQEVSLSSSEIISVEERLSMYTGGAHGYTAATYLNFDRNTGAQLSSQDLFENPSAAMQIIEGYFRSTLDINESDSINSTGFWFENDTFALPESIGLTKKDLILQYNAYEIASYAEGPITVKIPLSALVGQLSFSVE